MGSKKGKKKPGAASANPIKKAPAKAVKEPSAAKPEAPHAVPSDEAEAGIAAVERVETAEVASLADQQSPAEVSLEEMSASEAERQELPVREEAAGENPGGVVFSESESEVVRGPIDSEGAEEASADTARWASKADEKLADVSSAWPEREERQDEAAHGAAAEDAPATQSFSEDGEDEIPRLLTAESDGDHDDLEDWPEAVEVPAEEETPKLIPSGTSDQEDDRADAAWSEDFPRRSEGMKVRVIGGGSPKPPVTPARASQRKGLEIGFRIGAQKKVAGTAAWDPEESQEEEEVLRLEAPAETELPTRLQPIEVPEVAVVPFSAIARPKQKKKLTMRQWTICMAAGTVALVVGIVFITQLPGRKQRVDQTQSKGKLEVEKIVLDESESADLVRNITQLNVEAEASLKRFAAATTAEQALGEVREPERVKARFMGAWHPWPKPAFEKNEDFDALLVEGQGKPALGLGGYRGDFSRFLMLFVRVDGKMKLDWEASFGISDIDIAEMPEKAGDGPLMVRAILKKEAYYTPVFPEAEYSAYELFDPARDNHVWGYVPLKSKAADALANLLNQNSYVLETNNETSGIFRMTRKEGAQPNQFLILDVVQKGWVSP